MNDHYLVTVYAVYAGCALALTVWLARTLYNNGAVFLEEVFDRKEIAVAVNRLLVTGFLHDQPGLRDVLAEEQQRGVRNPSH
jgi:hypothetical protein